MHLSRPVRSHRLRSGERGAGSGDRGRGVIVTVLGTRKRREAEEVGCICDRCCRSGPIG